MEVQIIGLETDREILRYCRTRGIESIPLKISGYEINNGLGNFRTIEVNQLYRLVYETGLSAREFTCTPLFIYGSSRHHHLTHALVKRVIDPNLEKLVRGGNDPKYTLMSIDNHWDDCNNERNERNDDKTKIYLDCGTHMSDSLIKSETRCRSNNGLFVSFKKGYITLHRYSRPKEISGIRDITEKAYKPKNVLERVVNSFRDKKHIQTTRFSDEPRLEALLFKEANQNVYLTIDIDILSKSQVEIASYELYDQGIMQLDDLLNIVRRIIEEKKVIGIDICGMTPDPRCRDVYNRLIETIRSTEVTDVRRL